MIELEFLRIEKFKLECLLEINQLCLVVEMIEVVIIKFAWTLGPLVNECRD